jgi:hypothetical protein
VNEVASRKVSNPQAILSADTKEVFERARRQPILTLPEQPLRPENAISVAVTRGPAEQDAFPGFFC